MTIWQVCFMLLVWGMLGHLALSYLRGFLRGIATLQRLHQIPCSRCRFFSRSPYLKCPVQPTIALSEQAIGCRDYETVGHFD
ncbi:MAG: hypothetical protein ACO3EZ_02795 [Prochlorotrichaceae cyanobacterium]